MNNQKVLNHIYIKLENSSVMELKLIRDDNDVKELPTTKPKAHLIKIIEKNEERTYKLYDAKVAKKAFTHLTKCYESLSDYAFDRYDENNPNLIISSEIKLIKR